MALVEFILIGEFHEIDFRSKFMKKFNLVKFYWSFVGWKEFNLIIKGVKSPFELEPDGSTIKYTLNTLGFVNIMIRLCSIVKEKDQT